MEKYPPSNPLAADLIINATGGNITGMNLNAVGEYRNVKTHMAGAIQQGRIENVAEDEAR